MSSLKNFFSKFLAKNADKKYKRKYRLIVFGILLATAALSVYVAPNYYNSAISWVDNKWHLHIPKVKNYPYHLGLDLQGGTYLVYEADVSGIKGGDAAKAEALEGVRDVIERRINAFGISEPVVQTNHYGNKWRLIVELAGVHNVDKAIKMIGETPTLEFKVENNQPARKLTPQEKKEMEAYNKKAYEKAEWIIQQLKKGANFAELAKKYSQDPGSRAKGGELGWISRGKTVPNFEKAAFSLGVGQITPKPVKTVYGYEIIKVEGRRGGPRPDGSDGTEVKVRHILIRTKNKFNYVKPVSHWKNTGLSGKQLIKSQVEFNPNTNEPEVSLEFNDQGKKLFSKITKENIGKKIAIFLDGSPISIPVVNEQIRNGKAVITGNFSIKQARLLAERLNAGALPVPIKLISQNTIGASLGKASLKKSLKAGIYGFLAIILFLLLVYRLKGVAASIALIVYVVLTLAVFKFLGITLTLAGMAGLILSIGMAVDANVLIFERMKEEKALGKTGMQLIDDGFSRAWPSIRDGNISTLITCLILIWFSTSMVKGFAITLGIGILISMFSAVVVTRLILKGFSRSI